MRRQSSKNHVISTWWSKAIRSITSCSNSRMVLAETHSAARTQPFSIGNLRQWGIQTVDVIGWRTGITAQQLSSILADSTKLHMVVILFLSIPHYIFQYFLTFRVILLRFPLNSLFFLWEREVGKTKWFFHYYRNSPKSLDMTPHTWSFAPFGEPNTYTVWAAPFALWSFLHVWVQANHVVGTRAGITQYNFSSLLAHLTVVLMISLIAIHSHCGVLLTCRGWWVTVVQATDTGFLQPGRVYSLQLKELLKTFSLFKIISDSSFTINSPSSMLLDIKTPHRHPSNLSTHLAVCSSSTVGNYLYLSFSSSQPWVFCDCGYYGL